MGHAQKVAEAFGYLTPPELALLQKCAKELADESIIVNIGAGAGTSALAFIEARPDATVYTIDVQDASHPEGSLEGERNAFREAGLFHLLNDNWFQIHYDSKAMGHDWLNEAMPLADLVYIDGEHSYEGCAGDIAAWLPNLVPGGLLAIHDYKKAQNDPREYGRNHPFPGVDQAVDDLLVDAGYKVVGQADCLIVFRKELV